MERCDCAITTRCEPVPAPVLNEAMAMVMGIGGCVPRPIYAGGGQAGCCRCSGTDTWKMVIDTGGYSDIAWGETMTVTCSVRFNDEDRTADVIKWAVARDSGDSDADTIWNAAHTDFAGTIQIHYNEDTDDIRRTDGLATVFTFTAIVSGSVGRVTCKGTAAIVSGSVA